MQKNKTSLRKLLKERLRALSDIPQRSDRIWNRLIQEPLFREIRDSGSAIMVYLNLPREVETTRFLENELHLGSGKVVIPYCGAGDLKLFLLHRLEELEPGTLGILEPKDSFRTNFSGSERAFWGEDLGLILVPGLGFDLQGHRLGRGGGYYDRFLRTIPRRIPRIALAFECQILEEIPVEPHDQGVDLILTESRSIFPESSLFLSFPPGSPCS